MGIQKEFYNGCLQYHVLYISTREREYRRPELCGLRCWRLRSGFRSRYIDDNIGDGPYQFTFHMRPASMNVKVTEITGGKNTKEVLVPPTRIERATRGLGNRCSIQLSYGGVRRM